MRNKLESLLAEKGALLADGATGTNLFDMGLESGDAPELWNEKGRDKILVLHRGFIEAGSDILLTNSFGGTRQRLKLHQAQDRVHELNRLAAEIAIEAAASADREIVIAGSVGPTGELLAPLGTLTFEDAVSAFKEQMAGLKAGGADVLWIETMSSSEEIAAAAQAAVETELPYIVTASFDTAGKTMMGLAPGDLPGVTTAFKIKPTAIGANCGVGASDLLAAVLDMNEASPQTNIIAKANCGIPVVKGDSVVYTGTPELMHDYVQLALRSGAKIVGGCCGTSFDHIRKMRDAMDQYLAGKCENERPDLSIIEAQIGPMVNKTAGQAPNAPVRQRRSRRRA